MDDQPEPIVEELEDEVWYINGRYMHGISWGLPADEVERIRQGYKCIACMEPFETAFPERCNFCGYAVAADQVRRFGVEYAGEKRYGPTPLSEVDEMFGDERERESWKPRSGIWVPPNAAT